MREKERGRERERKREGERERERVRKRGRELHACAGSKMVRTSRKNGHALSVPHSVSQSACMFIILIWPKKALKVLPF